LFHAIIVPLKEGFSTGGNSRAAAFTLGERGGIAPALPGHTAFYCDATMVSSVPLSVSTMAALLSLTVEPTFPPPGPKVAVELPDRFSAA
jgi:hypothetical protein